MSTPLERVQDVLVTPNNPPRQIEGLDFERCIELHNAILEHGWLSSGRSAEDFQSQCTPYYERDAEVIDERCHDSLKAFFQGARNVPPGTHRFNFFYNVAGLNCAFDWHEYYTEEADRVLNLYTVAEGLYGDPDGIVYDQETNKAMMHFDIGDELNETGPWQPLESILSVWIEIIQRGKAVALHNGVCRATYGQSEWLLDANGNFYEVKGPERHPNTGAIRIGQAPPWTIVPWTDQDLTECLGLWKTAVDLIEEKMSLPQEEHEIGLVSLASLEALPIHEGFAKQFLLQAKKPRFHFIAPGLRVPTANDFIRQPFISMLDPSSQASEQVAPPILLLRSESKVLTTALSPVSFGYPHEGPQPEMCPAGLYLGRCDRTTDTPFEDGCELVLPFELENGWAKQSDLSDLVERSPLDSLLQSGTNPFNQRHSTQLRGFLEIVVANLRAENWTVDSRGVAGGLDVWKQADTEKWQDYWLPLGPGRFW